MFNHSIENNAIFDYNDDGSFVIRAKKDIRREEEIFISYGNKSVMDNLSAYGFIPEGSIESKGENLSTIAATI